MRTVGHLTSLLNKQNLPACSNAVDSVREAAEQANQREEFFLENTEVKPPYGQGGGRGCREWGHGGTGHRPRTIRAREKAALGNRRAGTQAQEPG